MSVKIWMAGAPVPVPRLEGSFVLDVLKIWAPGLRAFFWRVLFASVILFVGIRVARGLQGILKKTFLRMNLEENVNKFLLSAANAAMYALVVFMAAEKLGVPSASIVALMGSAGVAIGLSLKESLSNVAGGILIMLTRPFVIQDYIACGGVEGTVQDIGLVYTVLTTVDNRKVTIPNGTVANATVVNATAQEKRQLDLEVQVSYASDLKKAKEILCDILEHHPQVLREDGTRVFVKELGESAVVLGMRGWMMKDEYWPARWDIIESIKLRFDEEGIVIPFRQLVVHQDRDMTS
ncbi:mechanosensitive ion channel family protein [Clostridiaceae bacterium]|nr:mechanosensitive ion channel family protein [Clostridiaceae bacterium]RKI14118.1 mechanosensitive ion channel family protein [bacterium 1XD21-70]